MRRPFYKDDYSSSLITAINLIKKRVLTNGSRVGSRAVGRNIEFQN